MKAEKAEKRKIFEITLGAAAFLCILAGRGFQLAFAPIAAFGPLLTFIAFRDLGEGKVPNEAVAAGACGALLLSALREEIPCSLLGGALGFFLLLLPALLGREMGGGDIKLGGMIGLILGFPKILPALFLAALGACIWGSARRRRGEESLLPFAPFLCGAAVLLLALPLPPILTEPSPPF